MANKYAGEIDITIYHKVYPMKIDMSVIGEFQSETGKDFMHCMVKAAAAVQATMGLDSAFQRAKVMTEAVSMADAAILFHIAAKKMDKTVTLAEMEEAVLLEGAVERSETMDGGETFIRSYPALFADLAMFAVLGVADNAKKQFLEK